MTTTSVAGFFIHPGFSRYRICFLYALLSLFCYCGFPSLVWAGVAADVRKGNTLYHQQNYEEAIKKYRHALQKDAESDMINFNAGAALYQNKKYAEAQESFQKALLSDDEELKQKAHYNLGNTLYRMAEDVGSKNPQEALKPLEDALVQYEQALQIDPQDQEAQANYQFVREVLKKVKEQIRQQQSQCQNPQSQKNSDSSDQQNKNQNTNHNKNRGQDQNQGAQSDQSQPSSESRKSEEQQQGQDREDRPDQDDRQQASSQARNQGDEQQKQEQQSHETSSRHQQGADEEQGDSRDQDSGPENQSDQSSGASEGDGDQKTVAPSSVSAAKSREESEDDFSRREAKMRLDDYEQNQLPRGLLNLRGTFDTSPVEKDW